MKILTNIQNKEMGGINRLMFSVLNYSQKNEKNIDFVLVRVDSRLEKMSDTARFLGDESIFMGYKCYDRSYSKEYFLDALEKADSVESLKVSLTELINFYKIVLKKEKPDLVYINGTYYRPWCLLQAAKDLKIKYLVHFHGSAYLESCGLDIKKRQIIGDMEADFYEENAKFIFPSRLALEKSLIFQKHPNLNYRIIFNALNEMHFINSKKISLNSRKIAFILRWEEIKNTDFVLRFAKYNSVQNNPYQLVVVTDKNKEYILKTDIPYMEFLKPMPFEEIVNFYKQVDLVINPSHFETFGYVPAEAIACGTPALISEQQGVAEVFRKIGIDRLIVDFSNESKVFDGINEIVKIGISEEEVLNLKKTIIDIKLIRKIFEYIKK
ncbi:MAG: glycosyltransferase family 4 protein [Minisyncoccia bacterium]